MTASSDLDEAFEAKLAAMRARNAEGGSDDVVQSRTHTIPGHGTVTSAFAQKNMWLAHRRPEHYPDRCLQIGDRWICRRCSILYPIGVVVATLFAFGFGWPESWDMAAIWILCIPGTIAYCGEALGLFAYNARAQAGAMAVTALGFGRGLGYEFSERWSGEFWWPVTIFGGLWFAATAIGALRRSCATTVSPSSSEA